MKRLLIRVAMMMAALIAILGIYVAAHEPAMRPLNNRKIEATPERLARGAYLVENVSGCLDCHSALDQTKRTLPLSGPAGAGGACFTTEDGFPGEVCGSNITPDPDTGIGAWSDDAVMRALREGIAADGRALFPMMPYTHFREMADEDAEAVVAYLRTLEPVRRAEPHPTNIMFPVSFFIESSPEPITAPVRAPERSDEVAYGKYLARIAGCLSCHLETLEGGEEFPISRELTVRSSNITRDESGVLPPTREDFLRLFHSYRDAQLPDGVTENDLTVMPWTRLAKMTDEDLSAIHAYLLTVEPRKNQVQTYSRAD